MRRSREFSRSMPFGCQHALGTLTLSRNCRLHVPPPSGIIYLGLGQAVVMSVVIGEISRRSRMRDRRQPQLSSQRQ